MKKILALVMAVAMMLSLAVAEAPVSVLEMKPEDVLNISHEVVETNHVTAWEGQWVLSAAYIGECYIEEMELEDIEAGLYPVMADAIKLNVKPLLDASANDKATGPIVHQGNYWHAHTHDLEADVLFNEELTKKEGKITAKWDEWAFEVRGEQDGDFNYGPTKIHTKVADDFLFWNDIVGIDIGEEEEVGYMYLSTSGYLVLCYGEKNLTQAKYNSERVGFAFIFERVPAETPAE